MANLNQVHDFIYAFYGADLIDDEEFLLLHELNGPRNPHFPYQQYQFNFEDITEDDCWAEFRFKKIDIPEVVDILQLPNRLSCYNGVIADPLEGLCICLRRLAYPCRYGDLIPRFGRPVPQLSMLSNLVICRPKRDQRVVYNGHKRVHALKFQSVVALNGLIANLFGPVEGRRHDSGMLAMSGLLPQFEQFSYSPDGQALCIYGDLAYPHRLHLQCPFPTGGLIPQQQAFNQSMSSVRVSVEWIFGDIINYYKFMDFKKNLKI